MSNNPSPMLPDQSSPPNATGLTALLLSAFGLGGWITLCGLMMPYEDGSLANVLVFGFNFLVLIAAGAVSGTLSFAGFLMGAISYGEFKDRRSLFALLLGLFGLACGAAILAWRQQVVSG